MALMCCQKYLNLHFKSLKIVIFKQVIMLKNTVARVCSAMSTLIVLQYNQACFQL